MIALKNLYICCEEGREEFFKAKARISIKNIFVYRMKLEQIQT